MVSVEVLWNPFDDIVPRVASAPLMPLSSSEVEKDKNDIKQKATKRLNLLSFGEEAEEEEKELVNVVTIKIRSSYDVLNDPRLLKEIQSNDLNPSEIELRRDMHLKIRKALGSKRQDSDGIFSKTLHESDDYEGFDAQMHHKILNKRKEFGDLPIKIMKLEKDSASEPRSPTKHHGDHRPRLKKLALKKEGIGSEAMAELMANADTNLPLFGCTERERQLQKQRKRRRRTHEEETLENLEKFKSRSSFISIGWKDENPISQEELWNWMAV